MKKKIIVFLFVIYILIIFSIVIFAETDKWICNKEINPINDKPIITFTLKDENSNEIEEKPIYLILRYENGKTNVHINWNRDIYSIYRGLVTVNTRFGDKKSSYLSWKLYSGTKEIVIESIFGIQPKLPYQTTYLSRNKVSFIRKLLEVDTFAAQIKFANAPSIFATFDVKGLEKAIEQYNDILKWIK